MSVSDESAVPSPWLMLPPAFGGNDMIYKFYSLAENEVVSFNKTKDGDRKEIFVSTSERLTEDPKASSNQKRKICQTTTRMWWDLHMAG